MFSLITVVHGLASESSESLSTDSSHIHKGLQATLVSHLEPFQLLACESCAHLELDIFFSGHHTQMISLNLLTSLGR